MIGPGVGPDANLTLISNGEKMTALHDKSVKQQTTPKWLNDAYRATLTRSGLAVPLLYVHRVGEEPKEFKVDDEFKVSDFQLGKKEMVGDREVQAIKYNLRVKEFPEPLATTVWIDTKTNLPLKRAIMTQKGDDKISITETYTKLNLDVKIDPKMFELPKE